MKRRTVLSGLGALAALAVGATALGRLVRSRPAVRPTPTTVAATAATETPTRPRLAPSATATATPLPSPTPSSTPTPRPLRLAVSQPTYARWRDALHTLPARCPGWAVVPYPAPYDAERLLVTGLADAALVWSAEPPPGGAPLRVEPYVAAFHVTHPERVVNRERLAELARGEAPGLTLTVTPGGHDAVRDLLGVESRHALVVPSWEEAKEHVATHADAWALLPWEAVDHRVRAMPIDGLRPDPRRLEDYSLARRLWLRATIDDADFAPLHAVLADALRYEVPPTVELVAVGDVMLGRTVGRLIAGATPRWAFEAVGIAPLLQGADVTFGNLECPVSDRGQAIDKRYTFRADPSVVAGLTWAGFDVLSLANNHLGDYGQDAVRDTLAHLADAGLTVVGAGADEAAAHSVRLVTAGGLRLAFLAYNAVWPASFAATTERAGLAWLDEERMTTAVRAARDVADVVIVSCHWGIEYSAYPNASQERIARALADAGADLIVGHHPHVVQGVEHHVSAFTAYSLGNFVFDIDMTAESLQGVVMRCLLDATGVKTVEFVPVAIVDCRPEFMNAEDGEGVLRRMERVTRKRGALPAPRWRVYYSSSGAPPCPPS